MIIAINDLDFYSLPKAIACHILSRYRHPSPRIWLLFVASIVYSYAQVLRHQFILRTTDHRRRNHQHSSNHQSRMPERRVAELLCLF